MNLLFGSLRGSPGVTSLLVLLTHFWPKDCILIEADLSGGVLAARYDLSPDNPGLLNLVTGSRRNLEVGVVRQSCQDLPGGAPVVVATGRNSTMKRLLSELSLYDINQIMPDTDFLVDMGRTDSAMCSSKLLSESDLLILLAQPSFEQLNPLLSQLPEFSRQINVGVILVGGKETSKTEYSRVEIDTAIRSVSNDKACVIGRLPYDPKGAHICISEGPTARVLKKSLLARNLKTLIHSLEHKPHIAPSFSPTDITTKDQCLPTS